MESRPDSDSSSLKGKRDGSGVNLTALWPVVLGTDREGGWAET